MMNPQALLQQSRRQSAQGDLEGALATLQTLSTGIQHPLVYSIMGGLLRDMCDTAAALRCYDRAHQLSGDDAYRLRSALTLPPIMGSRASIAADRARMAESLEQLLAEGITIEDPVKKIPHLAFYLAYHGENDRELQALIARVVGAACPALQYTAPHVQGWRGVKKDKVEVVFISSNLKNHTIGRLNQELIRLLDRTRFRVTVALVGGPQDAFAQQIAASADAVIQLDRDLLRAQRQVAALGSDIVYYTDIGMDPFTWFLAHARLAPVQCVTWGHSMTTGLDSLDCWISGKDTEVDAGQDHYTEPLVRLSDPTVTYRRPVLTGPRPSRAELGLPESGTIYLCPQTTFKLHPDFDHVLGAILERDPAGHVVMLAPKFPVWKDVLLRRMRPHVDTKRLVFLPSLLHPTFLAVLAEADVLIDPVVYGGCNTSLEALAMGTPIVTMPSAHLRDRYTAAWYKAVGVEDCIVDNPRDYVDLAVRLGSDPQLRASIMRRVAERDDQLFDNPRSIREHERLFMNLLADKGR